MPGHVDACGFLVSPLALAEAEHKIFVLYSLYTCVYLNFSYFSSAIPRAVLR